ncbi:MAG: hypothetical protein E2586_13675 [Novosphingobium sp.]|uniref:hypothetical protein n=1 Tax=Novosphingobium sp. TaxID=1874826 RepID=UPI0012CB8836|nr:hypothetical protein [Novosphingobium sp.]MPS69534.1 hypothetical protein [Novosphingobium sp.]
MPRLHAFALLTAALALVPPASAQPGSYPTDGWPKDVKATALTSAQIDPLMRAAGYTKSGNAWRGCGGSTSVTREAVELRDLNGDGRPEALVVADGTECFGAAGTGFQLLRPVPGGWKIMTDQTGVATFLTTRGADGYPDLEIGGPGFCFPVTRWIGTEYRVVRFAYEGKACKPPG